MIARSSVFFRAAATAALAAAAACSRTQAPPAAPRVPVRVATAVRTSVPYDVTANGVVEPMQTVAVQSQVQGIVTQVAFTEGDDVRAGQVLFRIDPRPYQAALAQTRAALARDQAAAANAVRDAQRYAQLVKQDYVTKSQADQAQTQAVAQQATVDADRAAVSNAALDLRHTTIRAPIAGRTGSLLVHRGNLVRTNSTTPLVVINQIRPILVRFAVPEQRLPDIQRYRARAPLPVSAVPSADTTGSQSQGTLTFIDNTVDTATGTVTLKGRFANPEGLLWPGEFVATTLRLFVQSNVVTVPAVAVTSGQQGTYVFIVAPNGTARQQGVTVARTAGNVDIIAQGVAPGDRVVIDGQSRLSPGARVDVIGSTPGSQEPAS